MTRPTSDIAFTPAVKAVQERLGSRRGYAAMEQRGGWADEISDDLAAYLGARDSFYLGSASAEGRPYIQHRGGDPGFLKVLDGKTLAFADYPGNQQYISWGNLNENDKAFLFAMDYRNRRRVKIWGRAEFVEDEPELLRRLADDNGTPAPRAIRFHVEAWDVNCPKFIPVLYGQDEVDERERALRERIATLEAENQRLQAGR